MTGVRAQPLIAVSDVEASSRWYCRLLGCSSGHGGREYERIMDAGQFVLQLHDWNVDDHPHLGDESDKPWGNGVSLWFRVEDFDGAVARAGELGAEILEGPQHNERAHHDGLWLSDPDGYVVGVAGRSGWDDTPPMDA